MFGRGLNPQLEYQQWIQHQYHQQHHVLYHTQRQLHTANQELFIARRQLAQREQHITKLQRQLNECKENLKKRTIPKERKLYSELTNPGKRNRKDCIKTVFQNVCEDMSQRDTLQIKVQIKFDGHPDFTIDVRGQTAQHTHQELKDIAEAEVQQMAEQVLKVKDSFRIPFKALQALRTKSQISIIPPEKILQRESLRLATNIQTIPIRNVPSDDGYIRPLADVIEFMLDYPENRHILQTEEEEVTITLRFACDGAKITKYKNSVRAVCKLVKPPVGTNHQKESPQDEITLMLYMGKEVRTTFEVASKETMRQMQAATEEGVLVRGKTVKVNWLYCSDWKAMAIVKGINQANSKSFCLWCYCTKDDIHKFDKTWGVQRSHTDQTEFLERDRDQCGYIKKDLLYWVPYQDVVPDELHLRMRISNKLINQVVIWSVSQDKRTALLNEMQLIKVDFQFYEEMGDDGRGRIKRWTQLGGDDLRKVIKNFRVHAVLEHGPRDIENLDRLPKAYLLAKLCNITGRRYPKATKEFVVEELRNQLSGDEQRDLFANRPQSRICTGGAAPQQAMPQQNPNERVLEPAKIQEVWDEFDALMELIRTPRDSPDFLPPRRFQEAAKAWAVKFRKHTFKEDVIPYIHVLVYHVPEAMERHGFLPHVGISQVERKNYDDHLSYFQGTSKQGGRHRKKVTMQIMERENRMLHYRRQQEGQCVRPQLGTEEEPEELHDNEIGEDAEPETNQETESESDDEN